MGKRPTLSSGNGDGDIEGLELLKISKFKDVAVNMQFGAPPIFTLLSEL
jgi:hypothetical protein